MENLQVFKNEMFGEIRVVELDNEPWFVGKDIAKKLGYKNLSDSLGKHVDEEDKDVIAIRDSIGRNQNSIIINESGLDSLILSSKLQSAREFKRWVTKEVLPSIRQTGGYIPTNEEDDEESLMAKALIIAQNTLDRKNKKIKELKDDNETKDILINTVINDNGLFSIGDVGRVLKSYNSKNFGEKNIFKFMRKNKILIDAEHTQRHNLPYSKYSEYFETKYIENIFGNNTKTYFNGKGLKWFLNKLSKMKMLTSNEYNELKRQYNI